MLKQLSLFVENQPGALSAVCKVLKENSIDMRALSLADTQQFGILRMLVRDENAAKSALEKAGFVVKLTDVLALSVPDRAGGLADVLSIIDKYDLSVEYMYAFPYADTKRAALIFRFADAAAAEKALAGEAVEIIASSEIFG